MSPRFTDEDYPRIKKRTKMFCPSCGQVMIVYQIEKEGKLVSGTIHKPCGLPEFVQ